MNGQCIGLCLAVHGLPSSAFPAGVSVAKSNPGHTATSLRFGVSVSCAVRMILFVSSLRMLATIRYLMSSTLPPVARCRTPHATSEMDRMCGISLESGLRFQICCALNAGLMTLRRVMAPLSAFKANSKVAPVTWLHQQGAIRMGMSLPLTLYSFPQLSSIYFCCSRGGSLLSLSLSTFGPF